MKHGPKDYIIIIITTWLWWRLLDVDCCML